jgi:multicomponent Na+:H+ antiporter subunit E
MVLWVLLSGKLDAFHLGVGVFCCLLVAALCTDLFADHFDLRKVIRTLYGHLSYLPWLMWQIVVANLHVFKLALHPKMYDKLDPHLVRFHTRLQGPYAQTSFAQSITLTPGTITVRVLPDGVFIVHAVDGKSGDLSALRDMEARVARTFGES